MIEQLVSGFGSLEVVVDTTLLVALASAVWTVVSRLVQAVNFQLALRTREIEFALEPKTGIPENITSLNYLLIRYGNDTYLSTLASDQERHHGRLRNKIICVAENPSSALGSLMVKLRLHKRLGTQFKFFVDVSGDPKQAIDYLASHDTIEDVSCKERPKINAKDPPRYRIFFLLNRLDKEKTVDGHINNFLYPV